MKICRTSIYVIAVLATSLATVVSATFGDDRSSASVDKHWPRESGFVPDAETAIKIAEVIFDRFYGAYEISREKPFEVALRDGIWIVKGILPNGSLGGVAEIHIDKKDGKILYLFHGR